PYCRASGLSPRGRASVLPARGFLDSLTAREHALDASPQALLDAWITADRTSRLGLIRWLKRGGYLPLVRLPEPVPRKDPAHEIDATAQPDLARTLLHDPDSASNEH